jgi:hypothetical protein
LQQTLDRGIRVLRAASADNVMIISMSPSRFALSILDDKPPCGAVNDAMECSPPGRSLQTTLN